MDLFITLITTLKLVCLSALLVGLWLFWIILLLLAPFVTLMLLLNGTLGDDAAIERFIANTITTAADNNNDDNNDDNDIDNDDDNDDDNDNDNDNC